MHKYVVIREFVVPGIGKNEWQDMRRTVAVCDTDEQAKKFIFDSIIGARSILGNRLDRYQHVMPELKLSDISEGLCISAYEHLDDPSKRIRYSYISVWRVE